MNGVVCDTSWLTNERRLFTIYIAQFFQMSKEAPPPEEGLLDGKMKIHSTQDGT
jgi:hypothetical protein